MVTSSRGIGKREQDWAQAIIYDHLPLQSACKNKACEQGFIESHLLRSLKHP